MKINGSLGYIIDQEVVQDESVFLYNNCILDVLKCDKFERPREAF